MRNLKKSFSANFQDYDDLKDKIVTKLNKDLADQKALNMKLEVAYNLCKIENNQIRQRRIKYCLHSERNFWLQNYMEAKNKLINIDKKLLGETVNELLNMPLNTSDSGYGISEFDHKESVSVNKSCNGYLIVFKIIKIKLFKQKLIFYLLLLKTNKDIK